MRFLLYFILFLLLVAVAAFSRTHCLPPRLTNIWPNFYAWNCFTTCLCVLSFSIYSSLNFPFSYFISISVCMTFVSTIFLFSYVSYSIFCVCVFFMFFSIMFFFLLLSSIYSYDCYGVCCHKFFFRFCLSIHSFWVKWFTSPASSLFVRWTINRLYICDAKEKCEYLWLYMTAIRWKFQGKTELIRFFTITKLKPNNEPPNSLLNTMCSQSVFYTPLQKKIIIIRKIVWCLGIIHCFAGVFLHIIYILISWYPI